MSAILLNGDFRTFIDYFSTKVLIFRKSNPQEYFRRLDLLADNYEKTGKLIINF